jgi:hypothetical protein
MGSQLMGDASLADARLTGQHDQPAVTGHGIVQSIFKLGHLLMTANEQPACLSGTGHCLLPSVLGAFYTHWGVLRCVNLPGCCRDAVWLAQGGFSTGSA